MVQERHVMIVNFYRLVMRITLFWVALTWGGGAPVMSVSLCGVTEKRRVCKKVLHQICT